MTTTSGPTSPTRGGGRRRREDDDERSDSAAATEGGRGGGLESLLLSKSEDSGGDGVEEHRKLAKNAYAKFEDDDDDDSTSSSLDQSIFSEEEKLNDGGAPETPNSIDPEWLRRHYFYAAARHRERVLSDEENEYGITNARRTRRDEFGNAIINEDEDIDRVTMNSEDVFSRDDTTNDDYYEEGDSIFSEDSEFLRNAQNAAAHRNRGAGFNPFGMNMNSASTRNVRNSSGRDMRIIIINNNNNNNKNDDIYC